MRIIFFGTPDFAVPSLKALCESDEFVVAVVTQPDRVQGRGHKLTAPPVKEIALTKNIPVLQPESIRKAAFLDELSGFQADIFAVVAYGKILPASLLKMPPCGCVNVHASLLPKYRGAAPIQRAIIHGEKRTGITTMLMDEGLDTGDILLQEETEIREEDNALSLSRRLSEMGAALLHKTIQGLKGGSLKPVPQAGLASYAPPLKKDDGRIAWTSGASEILNLVRGTWPWPGAYCYLNGERITIVRAAVVVVESAGIPGRVEKVVKEGFCVGTGKGLLKVMEVRPQGKSAMSAAAFAHGRHLKEGSQFDVS